MQSPPLMDEEDIALSPTFIDFLARWVAAREFPVQCWPEQQSEQMHDVLGPMIATADFRLQRLLLVEEACSAINKVISWCRNLATGRLESLKALHDSIKFIVVIGIPRTGGSYLTNEVYRALGHESCRVPAAIAHDGFPEARPFVLSEGSNGWIDLLISMSEFFVMLELYFAKELDHAPIFVPKKATKAIYAPGLFRTAFGVDAEYLITVRHPLQSCVSTYEKAGGLPEGDAKPRSVIERWMIRDTRLIGGEHRLLKSSHYFEVYLRYWEQFHIRLALSGLFVRRDYRVVPFGKQPMEQTARRFHQRFGSEKDQNEFTVDASAAVRHPEWVKAGNAAVDRVNDVWRSLGLTFPREELVSAVA